MSIPESGAQPMSAICIRQRKYQKNPLLAHADFEELLHALQNP